MTTKLIKNLKHGDRLEMIDPDGIAVVQRITTSKIFRASGGCWALDLRFVAGEHKGKTQRDQHYPGDTEVHLASDKVSP